MLAVSFMSMSAFIAALPSDERLLKVDLSLLEFSLVRNAAMKDLLMWRLKRRRNLR
jgi:hypothetical protein